MLNLARERSLSMRRIVKNVCVIMRKQESLGSDGGGSGCIALQVRCRFPLVPNILFTRMQCDTSFRETFQDKDKLSANKLRSSGATISNFIVLHVHKLFQQFTLLLSLLPLHGHISNLNISHDMMKNIMSLIISLPFAHVCVLILSFYFLQVQPASLSR